MSEETLPDAIVAFARKAGRSITSAETVEFFIDKNPQTVRVTLNRLADEGRLTKIGRGVYVFGDPGDSPPVKVKRGRMTMTVDEYIKNREDMTFISVSASEAPGSPNGIAYEIVLRLDGTYYDQATASAQADFVSRTLGIKRW